MVSSFFGLYTAQRSLSASQTVLNVINNNIANANTKGYSRQSVELVTSSPYPQPIVGVQGLPGTFGTGAIINSITRTRDSFLDAQYRVENGTMGYFLEKQYAMQNVEGTLMEPSDSGISAKLDAFFESAQKLSQNPESLSVRTNFVQQAIDLSVVFNQQSSTLIDLRKSLVGDPTDLNSLQQSRLGIDIDDINNKLDNLANINREIITLKGNNVQPNDLLDQRDKLLDEIYELLPITVDETPAGSVNISLGTNILLAGGTVVNQLEATAGDSDNPTFIALVDPDTGAVNAANINNSITNGRIGGLLEMGGNDPSKLSVQTILARMDNLASELAATINNLQLNGQYIDSATGQLVAANPDYPQIFESSGGGAITAANIKVVQDIIDDPNRIAAAASTAAVDEVGSGSQALAIAQLRNASNAALGNATFTDYHTSTVSILGVQTKSNNDKVDSQDALLQQIDLRRESTSGVNMDEELVDLIRFQRSFEASSKVMSVVNNVLDLLINRMF